MRKSQSQTFSVRARPLLSSRTNTSPTLLARNACPSICSFLLFGDILSALRVCVAYLTWNYLFICLFVCLFVCVCVCMYVCVYRRTLDRWQTRRYTTMSTARHQFNAWMTITPFIHNLRVISYGQLKINRNKCNKMLHKHTQNHTTYVTIINIANTINAGTCSARSVAAISGSSSSVINFIFFAASKIPSFDWCQ